MEAAALGRDMALNFKASLAGVLTFQGEKMHTAKQLKERLAYNPDTGVFNWAVSRGCIKAGSVAGTVCKEGYRHIKTEGRNYLAHRLAWLFVYGQMPTGEIDHKDRNPDNNRISNLRLATSAENKQNTGMRSDNVSGLRGVTFRAKSGRWRAQITHNRINKHLGYFDTPGKAYAAYCDAAAQLHTCNPRAYPALDQRAV